MNADVLSLAQLLSVLVGAFGAPGLTFWVMKKMSREALSRIKENCQTCRSHLDEKIDCLGDTVHEALQRKLILREKLPVDYVRRDEFNRHLNGSNKPK